MINRLKDRIIRLIFQTLKKELFSFFKMEMIEVNSSHIKIQSTSDTLNLVQYYIENELRGVYMRFGDGDVYLLNKRADSYQQVNDFLAIEMKEAFECSGNNVHKCLAIHSEIFGKEEGMFEGNHLNSDDLAKELLKETFEFFIGCKIYSPVALHFIASNNIKNANNFLKLLKQKTKLFIGNRDVKSKTISLLFGNCKHIKTPTENAYNEIERIYNEAKSEIENFNEYGVVVVAMGCSGRPLMKRLFLNKYNIYLFDFGSLLDGFEGIDSRTWLKVNNIDYNKLIE